LLLGQAKHDPALTDAGTYMVVGRVRARTRPGFGVGIVMRDTGRHGLGGRLRQSSRSGRL
jgi:hypothetical protein